MKKNIEKREEYLKSILDFVKTANLTDVFTEENEFYDKYGVNLYTYIRVSTENQDFGRQLLELHDWAKKKDITIFIGNIYFDKFTGKKFNRGGYQDLKLKIGSQDYLVVADLYRLGRDWDGIMNEWATLLNDNIKIIIQDTAELSAALPNEDKLNETLEMKLMRAILLALKTYRAAQKIEEVHVTTKGGIEKARKQGKQIGRARGRYTSVKNFIEILRLQLEDNVGTNQAIKKIHFPKQTYYDWIKMYKEKYNVSEIKDIYSCLKAEENIETL